MGGTLSIFIEICDLICNNLLTSRCIEGEIKTSSLDVSVPLPSKQDSRSRSHYFRPQVTDNFVSITQKKVKGFIVGSQASSHSMHVRTKFVLPIFILISIMSYSRSIILGAIASAVKTRTRGFGFFTSRYCYSSLRTSSLLLSKTSQNVGKGSNGQSSRASFATKLVSGE